MTRFMMTLEESVRLVMFAFENAEPGDIFVQKSPAATVYDLAIALRELFESDSEISIIGARHGEKMYETLCSREEMSKAFDLGNYFRIPADMRDLNYTKYVQTDGPRLVDSDYTSENTRRLSISELKELLLSIDYVKEQLR
jgi:UDP-glucose 4-epimerase